MNDIYFFGFHNEDLLKIIQQHLLNLQKTNIIYIILAGTGGCEAASPTSYHYNDSNLKATPHTKAQDFFAVQGGFQICEAPRTYGTQASEFENNTVMRKKGKPYMLSVKIW